MSHDGLEMIICSETFFFILVGQNRLIICQFHEVFNRTVYQHFCM